MTNALYSNSVKSYRESNPSAKDSTLTLEQRGGQTVSSNSSALNLNTSVTATKDSATSQPRRRELGEKRLAMLIEIENICKFKADICPFFNASNDEINSLFGQRKTLQRCYKLPETLSTIEGNARHILVLSCGDMHAEERRFADIEKMLHKVHQRKDLWEIAKTSSVPTKVSSDAWPLELRIFARWATKNEHHTCLIKPTVSDSPLEGSLVKAFFLNLKQMGLLPYEEARASLRLREFAVFIDGLGLMQTMLPYLQGNNPNASNHQIAQKVSEQLKVLANSYNIPTTPKASVSRAEALKLKYEECFKVEEQISVIESMGKEVAFAAKLLPFLKNIIRKPSSPSLINPAFLAALKLIAEEKSYKKHLPLLEDALELVKSIKDRPFCAQVFDAMAKMKIYQPALVEELLKIVTTPLGASWHQRDTYEMDYRESAIRALGQMSLLTKTDKQRIISAVRQQISIYSTTRLNLAACQQALAWHDHEAIAKMCRLITETDLLDHKHKIVDSETNPATPGVAEFAVSICENLAQKGCPVPANYLNLLKKALVDYRNFRQKSHTPRVEKIKQLEEVDALIARCQKLMPEVAQEQSQQE